MEHQMHPIWKHLDVRVQCIPVVITFLHGNGWSVKNVDQDVLNAAVVPKASFPSLEIEIDTWHHKIYIPHLSINVWPPFALLKWYFGYPQIFVWLFDCSQNVKFKSSKNHKIHSVGKHLDVCVQYIPVVIINKLPEWSGGGWVPPKYGEQGHITHDASICW